MAGKYTDRPTDLPTDGTESSVLKSGSAHNLGYIGRGLIADNPSYKYGKSSEHGNSIDIQNRTKYDDVDAV